ncbi:MAG: helix-turn-helix domain-containing protein [Balneolaceae bacterium]
MSLGKELASIRKSKNLTLEDIQNAVKIPLDTLKSIENGSIFSDTSMNKTYVRSFVRSYAKVLKLDDDDIVHALDEIEAGTYSGSLTGEEPDESHQSHFSYDAEESSGSESDGDSEIEKSTDTPKNISKPKKKVTSQTAPDDLESINWADLGRKFTTATKSSRVWLFVLLFGILVALSGSGYIFWDDIYDFVNSFSETTQPIPNNSDQNIIIPAPVDSSEIIESQEPETSAQPEIDSEDESSQNQQTLDIGETLTVTVYAAYGQLEPVRVTSDLNWRTNPFWMEEGEAYNFDFRDTLLVRGQYSRLLLLFNGHVIENPRQNYFNSAFNSIMITRSVLNQPSFLAPPPSQFPLQVGPPDSAVYRIRY